MAKIIEEGLVIPFGCPVCKCVFVVGIDELESHDDGNFYHTCPTCGCECHTDVARIPSEYYKAVEAIAERSKALKEDNTCDPNEPEVFYTDCDRVKNNHISNCSDCGYYGFCRKEWKVKRSGNNDT